MAKSKRTAKGSSQSFWNTARQAPSVVSLAMGFAIVGAGLISSTILSILMNIAGVILIVSGIVGIYLLGGANRKIA